MLETKMESSKPDLSSLRIDRGSEYRPPRKWWKWILAASVVPLLLLGYFILMRSVTPGLTVQIGSATLITGSQAQALLACVQCRAVCHSADCGKVVGVTDVLHGLDDCAAETRLLLPLPPEEIGYVPE